MKQTPAAILLALTPGLATAAYLEGTVGSAEDRSAPKMAHLTVWPAGSPRLEPVAIESSGQFRVEVPSGTPLRIIFTAVDHESHTLVFPGLSSDESVGVEMLLALNDFPDPVNGISLIGSWAGEVDAKGAPKIDSRAPRAMTQTADGTFVLSGPSASDSLVLQFSGFATNGHTVNTPGASRYVYDGGGDYFSVLDTPDSLFRIEIRPEQLRRGTAEVNALFDPEHSALAEINRLPIRISRAYGLASSGSPEEWEQLPQELLSAARDASDSSLRQYCWLSWLSVTPPISMTKGLVSEALNALPPSSPLWALDSGALTGLFFASKALDPEQSKATGHRFAKHSPVPDVQLQALGFLLRLTKEEGAQQAHADLYQRLTRDFAEHPSAQRLLQQYDPDHPVQNGRPAPDFSAQLVPDGPTISPAELRGQFVLLDFWATWCGPCKREMPVLHRAYETFSERNLKMISLSTDADFKAVDDYRKGQWAMPWNHAHLGRGNAMAKAFRVTGIPFPVLITPEGTIGAHGGQLRGEGLMEILEAMLPKSVSP